MRFIATFFILSFLLWVFGKFLPLPEVFSLGDEFQSLFSNETELESIFVTAGDRVLHFRKTEDSSKNCQLAIARSAEEQGSWELVSFPGAPLRIAGISWLRNFHSSLRKFERLEVEDLSPFGFEHPSMQLDFQKSSHQVESIVFGRVNEYLEIQYAKLLPGNLIYLIPLSALPKSLDSEMSFLLDQPFQVMGEVPQELSLTRAEKSVSFRRTDGGWSFDNSDAEAKHQPRADKLGRILQGLRMFKAKSVLSPEDSRERKFTQAAEVRELAIAFKNLSERRVTLYKGEAGLEDGYLALDDCDCVYQGDISNMWFNQVAVEAFQDTRILPFDYRQTRTVRLILSSGKVLQIEGRGYEWSVNGSPGDRVFVEDYFKRITSIEGEPVESQIDQTIFAHPVLTLIADVELPGEGPRRRSLVVSKDPQAKQGIWLASVDNMSKYFRLSSSTLKKFLVEEDVLLAASKNSQ